MLSPIMIVPFVSKASSAGVVHAMFGFVPDLVIGIFDIDGTNPNIRIWANNDEFSTWASALSLLITGSSGIITRDTSGITAFEPDGAGLLDEDDTDETTDSDPKHVDLDGTAAVVGDYFKEGISIPADHQTASGKNLLIAWRRER